jgi:hypothetical protein
MEALDRFDTEGRMPEVREHGAQRRAQPEGSRPGRPRQSWSPSHTELPPPGGLFHCGWETRLRPWTGSTPKAGCRRCASTARSAARSPKGRGQEGRDNPGRPAAPNCRLRAAFFVVAGRLDGDRRQVRHRRQDAGGARARRAAPGAARRVAARKAATILVSQPARTRTCMRKPQVIFLFRGSCDTSRNYRVGTRSIGDWIAAGIAV